MKFYCHLLLVFLLTWTYAQEAEITKKVKVKNTNYICFFKIFYKGNTCFGHSTVSCTPNQKRKRVARNVELELKDGTVIRIKKIIIKRKKEDQIIGCKASSPAMPNTTESTTAPTTKSPSRTSISDTCTVIEGPAKGEACVFPFLWSGQIYNECAYDSSLGDTYFWCSTKVDSSGTHVTGNWGKCDLDTCPLTSITPETSTASQTTIFTTPEFTTLSPTTTSVPDTCTAFEGPAKGEACVFPFVWSGKTYNECAYESSGDTYFWCSTKVDSSGTHISGNWGKCDPDTCPLTSSTPEPNTLSPTTISISDTCSTVEGPAKGEDCVFPFFWSGKTYNECALDSSLGDTYFWCCTKVDPSGTHIAGNWGKCDPDTCPLSTGVTTTIAPPPPVITACKCGLAKRQTRIVGGIETGVNEYPWLVALVSTGGSHPFCGGTLINSKWVLTATHCTDFRDGPSSLQVILGEHNYLSNAESKTVRRNVIQILEHPRYNSDNYDFDFCLLELSFPIDFSQNRHIRPACLPETTNTGPEPDLGLAGTSSTVAGWGTTSPLGSMSTFVQEVDVNIYTSSQCKSAYPDPGRITSRMICAGVPAGGKDSCQGDSGGPLVHSNGSGVIPGENYDLTGVVSWGKSCAMAGLPGVYAKVSYVLPWIHRHVKSGEWCSRT